MFQSKRPDLVEGPTFSGPELRETQGGSFLNENHGSILSGNHKALVRQYDRYGYRKIAELLRSTGGWVVNDKRVERIWRREGLKVPERQPKKGRLWLADGCCIRLRAE